MPKTSWPTIVRAGDTGRFTWEQIDEAVKRLFRGRFRLECVKGKPTWKRLANDAKPDLKIELTAPKQIYPDEAVSVKVAFRPIATNTTCFCSRSNMVLTFSTTPPFISSLCSITSRTALASAS